jgi:hypothetical protein
MIRSDVEPMHRIASPGASLRAAARIASVSKERSSCTSHCTTILTTCLDSKVPAQTPLRQTGAAPRSRLVCIEMGHGAAGQRPLRRRSNYWSPRKSGVNFDLSYSLEFAPCLFGST